MGKKLTLKDMQGIAKARSGECLSEKYVNSYTRLRWRCEEGHEWEAKPSNVKSGTWCRRCSYTKIGDIRRSTIEDMQDIAEERGGECLSKEYVNYRTKLKWKCKEGHVWEAVPSRIKGDWCPFCTPQVKLTIKDMQNIAKVRSGECLSKEFAGYQTKLKWRCKEGHEWEATPHNIKNQGTWCPICAGNLKLTIEDMQKLAISKGGECLSKKYVNSQSKLRWRCKEGHMWEARPKNIKYGRWCPICGNIKQANARRLGIEKMQDIAKARDGECLSKDYINVQTKLRWRCKEGHEWEAIPTNIKNGSWCPICARKRRVKAKEVV